MQTPNILTLIRARPALYLGSNSIVKLKAFLDGYYFSQYESDPNLSLKDDDEELFWLKFQDWIANKYQIKSSQSWASIISFFSTDDANALDRFFELVDEFMKSFSCD